jgi:hypothetical protein
VHEVPLPVRVVGRDGGVLDEERPARGGPGVPAVLAPGLGLEQGRPAGRVARNRHRVGLYVFRAPPPALSTRVMTTTCTCTPASHLLGDEVAS